MYSTISQQTLLKTLEGKGDRIVIGGRNRPEVIGLFAFWLVGVILFGALLLFGMYLSSTSPTGPGANGRPPFVFFATPLAILTASCYLLGGWSSRLTLDLTSRTYLHEYGLYPILLRRRGSLDEFDHVAVAIHHRTQISGGVTSHGWLLQLVRKDGDSAALPARKPASTSKPPTLWIPERPDPQEMSRVATILAQTVGLPFEDTSEKGIRGGFQADR